MITVISLTQFAFLSLGIMALKILIHASSVPVEPNSFTAFLDYYGLLLYALPVLWIAYATACVRIDRGALSANAARVVGVIISAAIFICFTLVIMLPRA
ncbi:MAG: hypothetical protein PHO08_14815 [Methylococcales bacterium]|nr:hypothetical protein [Methylococcales bacterium]MDD5632527.1 hypothetical protein [Methylococcales bacterium]